MSTLPPYQPPPPIKEGRGVLFWVAMGCSGCLTLLVLFVIVVYAMVVGFMKSSTPVKETLKRANANPQLVAALGRPIEAGLFFTGNLNAENNAGSIDLSFSIKGPSGKGRAYVRGMKDRGTWSYEEMRVTLPNGTVVDLLAAQDGAVQLLQPGDPQFLRVAVHDVHPCVLRDLRTPLRVLDHIEQRVRERRTILHRNQPADLG